MLIITGNRLDVTEITGKGKIAAADTICEALEFANIINTGETAENFRGAVYENDDDFWENAVNWDPTDDFNGWLGSWKGCEEGQDSVDFIKFTAETGDIVSVSGIDSENWTLLDSKGRDIGQNITAAGEYIIKVNNDDDRSRAYSIALSHFL